MRVAASAALCSPFNKENSPSSATAGTSKSWMQLSHHSRFSTKDTDWPPNDLINGGFSNTNPRVNLKSQLSSMDKQPNTQTGRLLVNSMCCPSCVFCSGQHPATPGCVCDDRHQLPHEGPKGYGGLGQELRGQSGHPQRPLRLAVSR